MTEMIPYEGTLLQAYGDDAGYDLHWLDDEIDGPVCLPPMGRMLALTGVRIAIPPGCVGLVCPRSGLASRQGVTVLNAPGIIDSGYTGEILVNLINLSQGNVWINQGDRIAQLLIVRLSDAKLYPAEPGSIDSIKTDRGNHGHGSTGA